METGTVLIVGGLAFLLWKFVIPGTTLANLKFFEDSMNFDVSNPLRIVVNVTLIAQNPTSGAVNLQSMAGYFFINGKQSGNVSFFPPPPGIQILPNSQTFLTLQLSINDIALIGVISEYVNGRASDLEVNIQATANANNIPMPVNITFQPL